MFKTCIVNTDTNIVVNIVEYETEQTGTPPGFSDTYLCVPSEDGQIGGEYIDGKIVNPIPPDAVPSAAQNKQIAAGFLAQTDWTTIPDIADPTVCNPYLTNRNDFIAYRNTVRAIAVNPTAGFLTWPNIPKAIWGM
jgi:hypothetical protein